MIAVSWDSSFEPNSFDADRHVAALMGAFRQLKPHIAKKHLAASMKKTLKDGVPILRRYTPPVATKRGRKKKGSRSTGDLRRRVMVKSGFTGSPGSHGAFVWGVLGYRMNGQDRKPIWLNYGTDGGTPAFRMIERAMREFGPISASKLAAEMAKALEKASREIASGKNPGMSKRGLAAGLKGL